MSNELPLFRRIGNFLTNRKDGPHSTPPPKAGSTALDQDGDVDDWQEFIDAPKAVFTPQFPLRGDVRFTSWIGGSPDMPDDMAWPQIGNEDAYFLCQLDCSRAAFLWGVRIPNEGWLRIFVGNGDSECAVLWSERRGQPRHGPVADWATFNHRLAPRDLVRKLPRWPLDMKMIAGSEDEKRFNRTTWDDDGISSRRRPSLYEGFLYDPRPFHVLPKFRPVDAGSLRCLIAGLRDSLESCEETARIAEQRPGHLQAFMADVAQRLKPARDAFEDAAQRAEADLAACDDTPEAVMSVVDAFFDIARKIEVPWIEECHETSIDVQNASLFRAQRPGGRLDWSRKYKQVLYENALAIHATYRNGLRPELYNELIKIWDREAASTRIRLGPYLGHCGYSDIAIDELNKTRDIKVVATLDPSDLFGWRWGERQGDSEKGIFGLISDCADGAFTSVLHYFDSSGW